MITLYSNADLQARICDTESLSDEVKEETRIFLVHTLSNGRNIPLDLDMAGFGEHNQTLLSNAVQAIAKKTQLGQQLYQSVDNDASTQLSRTIAFPYSRHSSYPELCHLVAALRPRDIWPCTVNVQEWAKHGISVKKLFGEHCSGSDFRHDILVDAIHGQKPYVLSPQASQASSQPEIPLQLNAAPSATENALQLKGSPWNTQSALAIPPELDGLGITKDHDLDESQASTESARDMGIRAAAFQTMLGNVTGQEWEHIGLISVSDNHTFPDQELGEL